MRKTLVALAAAVAGLIVAFAPTAANAYPDPVLTNLGGNAADGVVAPGEAFTLTGAFDGVDCNPWTVTFTGGELTPAGGSGTTFAIAGTAPTTPGAYTITFTCQYNDGQPTVAPIAFNPGAAIQTLQLPFALRVAAPGATPGGGNGSNASNGVLPSTGGPAVALLAAGGALVLAGGAVVAVRRRQAA